MNKETSNTELKTYCDGVIAANCAKVIKALLRVKYPDFKISVNSRIFSGCDAVSICVTGNVSEDQKQEIRIFNEQFQQGNFNSMNDIYENNNLRSDIPQVKYVITRFETNF